MIVSLIPLPSDFESLLISVTHLKSIANVSRSMKHISHESIASILSKVERLVSFYEKTC